MVEQLYIYGCGGHAKVIAATARLCGYEIAGFWEDSNERVGMSFCGSEIIRFEDVPHDASVFIAFGNNQLRLEKGLILQKKYHFPFLIHPSAQVATDVYIGDGTYIGALANIDPDCRIGNFCIVNNSAVISHDTVLHDGCHICGGSIIAGHGVIGQGTFMGIHSSMIENCEVGDNSVVGAGCVVISSLPSNITAVGIPARIIKNHQE